MEVVATYRLGAEDFRAAGRAIAMEQSTGTWTEVGTADEEIHRKYAAKVLEEDEATGVVKISFPLEDFSLDVGGISNILSIIAGNLFGLREVRAVKLLDVDFPPEAIESFDGPAYGIPGIRKILHTQQSGRPHIGTIIKPKIGLPPKRFAKVAYEAACGGVDFIKDDETLVNQSFCPLEERVTRTMEALDKAVEEGSRPSLYAPNVTSDNILESAQMAVDSGARALMLDFLTAGFPALVSLREDFSLPIHVHRTMHGAVTRIENHGIAMLVFSKLVRLAGGDQLHAGCAKGKMERGELLKNYGALRGECYGIKPVFPVCSGGVHPGYIEGNIRAGGKDVVIQAGGGIHGHPLGTRAGARAMLQAVEALMHGIPIREYAKEHRELRLALDKWGEEQITAYYR